MSNLENQDKSIPNNHTKSTETLSLFNWKHLADQRFYSDNPYTVETLKKGIDLKSNIVPNHDQSDETSISLQLTNSNQYANDSFIIDKKETFTNEKTIYHCYWYGEIGRKQAFSIKSLLCTQNLNQCRVILWLDDHNSYKDHQENPYLRDILPFIEVRAYIPSLEVKDSPWQDYPAYPASPEYPTNYYDLVMRADSFRFLILYKYGGIYFDLDMLFLKDFDELRKHEFCYAWENEPYANSAILSLKRHGEICRYLLKRSLETRSPSPWIVFRYEDVNLKKLYVLPSAFFDPIWQGVEKDKSPLTDFTEFFAPFEGEYQNKFNITSCQEFFPGCYAFHWHNQWNAPEVENSFFGIFEKEFDRLLAIKIERN